MILGKKVCLYVLIAFLSGCAPSAIEPPNSAVDADSIAEEPESIVSTDPPVEGPDSVTNTNSLVEIEFVESAPKDRFVITNIGSCALDELMIDFDLSQSAGKLIFDTTATGAGVEVFQPFEVEEGDIVQLTAEGVGDGDAELAIQIAYLAPGDTASFTIDVDDTLPAGELGQIRVSDSEISGGIVNITVGNSETTSTRFNNESTAQTNLPACS